MTKKQRLAAIFGKMAAASAISLLTFFAGSQAVYAAGYDLYIGSTQVTDANASDILGDGTASYDAATKTLTLNGVHIGADSYYEAEYYGDFNYESVDSVKYSMFADNSAVLNLVINGENSFTGEYGIFFRLTGNVEDMTINGTGMLKSTVVAPSDGTATSGIAMSVYGYGNINDLYIGKEEHSYENGIYTPISCTGPRLELTGLGVGAMLSCNNLYMQGGTVIAKATNTGENGSLGIYMPSTKSIFSGGTIAAMGSYSEENEDDSGAFATSSSESFNGGGGKAFGMKCVYPEGRGNSNNPLAYIDGWGVVGMTADGFKEQTDAVLNELNISGGGTDPVDPDNPGGEGGGTGTNEEVKTGSSVTGNDPTAEAYADTDIDVWGHTKDATIYSVDVEWGAMTFRYEKSSWDAVNHKLKTGAGWQIYDSANKKVIDGTQDTINQVTVTNHSNADVYAQMSYAGETDYNETTGGFTFDSGDTTNNIKAAWDETKKYFTLQTAATDASGATVADDAAGTPAKGNVYFMPTGINKTGDVANTIAKWTSIGKITVAIKTEAPTT